MALLAITGDHDDTSIQAHVDEAMAAFPRFEQVKRWAVLPEPPSEENGLLTPTLKLKRGAVMTAYSVLIDSLYDRNTP